jgi:hypothetical protein
MAEGEIISNGVDGWKSILMGKKGNSFGQLKGAIFSNAVLNVFHLRVVGEIVCKH